MNSCYAVSALPRRRRARTRWAALLRRLVPSISLDPGFLGCFEIPPDCFRESLGRFWKSLGRFQKSLGRSVMHVKVIKEKCRGSKREPPRLSVMVVAAAWRILSVSGAFVYLPLFDVPHLLLDELHFLSEVMYLLFRCAKSFIRRIVSSIGYTVSSLRHAAWLQDFHRGIRWRG